MEKYNKCLLKSTKLFIVFTILNSSKTQYIFYGGSNEKRSYNLKGILIHTQKNI